MFEILICAIVAICIFIVMNKFAWKFAYSGVRKQQSLSDRVLNNVQVYRIINQRMFFFRAIQLTISSGLVFLVYNLMM